MAPTTAVSSSKQKIHNSLRRWRGSLDPDDRKLFKAFVGETLSRLRGPFLAHHPPKQVLTYLEEAFQFARRRAGGQIKAELRARPSKGVAVFNCMNDQPFIVDTIRMFLQGGKADYWGGFNLVFRATRDDEGNLVSVGNEDATPESLVMLEADAGHLLRDPEMALEMLVTNLTLARAMVSDFKAMTRAVERAVEKCEVRADRRPDQAESMRETAAFLKWMLRENFVFMGMTSDGEPMGIQTVESPFFNTADGEWSVAHSPGTVQVRKSAAESPVHRSGRIDEILVSLGDADDMHGLQLFIRGMFTYRAVTQPSRNVPILRKVLGSVLEEQSTTPGSYRYKGIANVYDSLPTEFLFTATHQAINEMVNLVFESEQQQEVGVTFLMTGAGSAFCLVAMPKSQFGDRLRRDVENLIVGDLDASYCDHGIFVSRYDTVLVHYYLTGVNFPGEEQIVGLTQQIRDIATPWLARLWHELAERYDEAQADRLADTYGRAFPDDWVRNTSTRGAVRAIEMLEALSGKRSVIADFHQRSSGDMVLRLYQATNVYLTDMLPVLDNFGLSAKDSYATTVNSRGGALHIDTFRLSGTKGACTREQLIEGSELLIQGLESVYLGEASNDRLNALVLTSGLTWQEVDVIRGLARYAGQLHIKLSAARIQEILLQHPVTCTTLIKLFHARFDPDLKAKREKAIAKANEVVTDELRQIISHDADLIVSALQNLINAAVRTSFYRTDRKLYSVSFKFDCSQVKAMGAGRPLYEIYVHSREVEGVHLRFGMVARGGLRWSDRDDFRTEVLSLATTQQVKNVVIVPTGSKGGFYLKHASFDRAERRKEADRHYQTFIRGLLDVTDNSVNGETVKPPRVFCHDGDDPYLVVAADKGTAHLSDTANKISVKYGFWLADAFASGGSNGYDHKGVGITARGTWKLVRRHFAEMGHDPYTQSFTVVGIGDMGGDVFGNGLIESEHAKLKAAFNHLHIFLDPDPDPQSSWNERDRLFKSQGGWDKYDTKLISKGGGVFDRRHKSVPLSPQAQAMLGIDADEALPEVVINAILKMEVDLLWNGGIGTYVKASSETHGQADDRANNNLRVDATELRAKIVGEGGNLGFTQKGRIEANACGVRLNTDAIDNSGGVDMSDHEVNLKILLGQIVSRDEMSTDERNTLLEAMTDEVADLVLVNNDANGRMLSRDTIRSKEDIFQFGRAIHFVEREFGRTAEDLNLPDDIELARRAEVGEGLTRPELAVLSAWVKMYVFQELMKYKPKQLPGYHELLHTYFPQRIQESYPDDIDSHMLADEIAMTVATSRMVGDAGAAFFPMTIETTAATVFEIATAYLKAQKLAEAAQVRATLEELRTSVALEALYRAWVMVDAGAREVARYWLSSSGRIPTDDELEEMTSAAQHVYELQHTEVLRRNADLAQSLADDDITADVALRILKSQYLNIALMVWAESKRTDTPFTEMVVRHLAIARASRLDQLLHDLQSRPAGGRWDPIALRILHSRYHNLLRALVGRTPINGKIESVDKLDPMLAAGALKDVRAQVDAMLGDSDELPSVATLLVLEERLAAAISRIRN